MGHPNQELLFQRSLEEGIWEVNVDAVFASGDRANNKVDWSKLFLLDEDLNDVNDPLNFALSPAGELIVGTLVEVTDEFAPDLLIGVPSGGQRFATAVARVLGIQVARLKKVASQPGQKNFAFEDLYSQTLVEDSNRVAIIEDVTTKNTSLAGVLRVPGVSQKELHLQAIQRRDDGSNELVLPFAVNWLIDKWPIPNVISSDNPTYKKWGYLALGELIS